MAFLKPGGEFEKQISRGVWSHRSSRLDAVVAAIEAFTKGPSSDLLQAITEKFNLWKEHDPKEFVDRGRALEAQLRHEIRAESKGVNATIPVVDPAAHPSYNPGLWNDAVFTFGQDPVSLKPAWKLAANTGWVQLSTNCYAYACDDPHDHPYDPVAGYKPQPGELSGKPIAALEQVQHASVRWHVMKDDLSRLHLQEKRLVPLIRLRDEPIPDYVVNVPGHYLIALLTAPFRDYHWARQDRDGTWSHKPGNGRITNLDHDQNPIYDPRDANFCVPVQDEPMRWVKYQFSTFFYAPRGGVRTGSLGAIDQDQLRYLWAGLI